MLLPKARGCSMCHEETHCRDVCEGTGVLIFLRELSYEPQMRQHELSCLGQPPHEDNCVIFARIKFVFTAMAAFRAVEQFEETLTNLLKG
jgi:hypothetical protein